jgi:hypothetical protein
MSDEHSGFNFFDWLQTGNAVVGARNVACELCHKTPWSLGTYAIVRGRKVYCGRCYQNARAFIPND